MENIVQKKSATSKKSKEYVAKEEYIWGQYMTPEWEVKHAQIQKEINENTLPSGLSFARFAKTQEEREEIKKAVLSHRAECRKYGVNHKKFINVSPEQKEKYFAKK